MPTAPLNASSSTSQSVGWVCTIMLSSCTVVPAATAFEHSWMRSAAWIPMMCTATTSPVSSLKRHLAIPFPSSSASAFELARNDPVDFPRVHPSFSARSLACSSVGPTMAISGWVKHAAGMASWFTAWSLPHMFSIADMPCADAAWASIIFPLASPMQYTWGTTEDPSPWLVRTRIFSSTATNPRLVSMPASSSPMLAVLGTRPVATMAASTSSVSTCSLVSASIISMVTGFSPGIPGVTLLAKTLVR
mmetsp:Transcript_12011/g.27510  ORF Transcript_12011/g.27510 Transcript_12011/m.27510 type:complete len:248 (-) Transcript_12011:804-1547(-)